MARGAGDLPGSLCRRANTAAHHGACLVLWETVLFGLIIVGGTLGELCVARAMKKVGEVTDFRPVALVRVIFSSLRVGWMWLGVTLMAVAFFALLGALS